MIKRLASLALAVAFVAGVLFSKPGTVVIKAQTLPVTKNVAWDANPAGEGVLDYIVRLDGVVVANPTTTTQAVTFTTQGLHTITVTARNTWGTGPAGTLNVDVRVPGPPNNVRIP